MGKPVFHATLMLLFFVTGTLFAARGPIWISDPITLPPAQENAPYTVSLSTYVSSLDAPNAIRFFFTVPPPKWLHIDSQGNLYGTPGKADIGGFSFEVTAADMQNNSSIGNLHLTVSKDNYPPAWTENPIVMADAHEDLQYTFDFSNFASDPDGDTLVYSKTSSGPSWMTISADGKVSGVPTKMDIGPETVSVRVTDPDGLTADAEASITVVHTNHPPVINPLMPNFQVNEGEVSIANDLKPWLQDPDGTPVHCTLVSLAPWLSLSGDCVFTANFPPASEEGTHAYAFTVDDGQSFTQGSLFITVRKIAKPPVWLSEPITPVPFTAITNSSWNANIANRAKDPSGKNLTFSKNSGPAWLMLDSSGGISGTPSDANIGNNVFSLRVCNEDALCTDGTLLVTVLEGFQTDSVQIDAAVPGAPAEYQWIVDNSDSCDTTVSELSTNIHLFYEDLDNAQIHHSGVYLSSDVKKYNSEPIHDSGSDILLRWTDPDISATWQHRKDLGYSDGACYNCMSSPLWPMYNFYSTLPIDPDTSQIYHNGYYMPQVPMDAMLVTHQMDHYRYFAKNIPAVDVFTPDNFASNFILFHQSQQKAFRVSAIAPECPTLLDSSGDPTSVGPADTYHVLVNKTGGKYYSSACNFDPVQTMHDWAQQIIFRAYVHAKNRIHLSRTPMSLLNMIVMVGGVPLAPGLWSYDPSTNDVLINWYLIDQGQLKPLDVLAITYRFS